MILRSYRGQLLVVRQSDHARQCAAFARHWGNAACERPAPVEALAMAAGEHDNGWDEWDVAPVLSLDTGRPYQVFHLPAEQHVPLYRRGIQRAAARDPYAGILVSMHGAGLYNDRYGTCPIPRKLSADERALVAAYLSEQEALQAQLRAAAGRDARYAVFTKDDAIWRNYKLLQVWDRMSLQFCYFGCASGEISPAPLRPSAPDDALVCVGDGDVALTLSPYPFDESPLVFDVPARLVPDRRYEAIEHFLEAYDRAEPIAVPYRAVA